MMERLSEYTERLRREDDTKDLARVAWALSGARFSHKGLEQRLKSFGRSRLDPVVKSAVAGGTTQSGNWAAGFLDMSGVAAEWVGLIQSQTLIGKLRAVRAPFNVRVLSGTAPDADFVGPGVGIPAASVVSSDFDYLKRTAIGTIVIFSNELVRSQAPGVIENVNALLARSVVNGMDAAALDPNVAGVTDERPASLLYGVAPLGVLAATSAGAPPAVQAMLEALVNGGSDLRSAVFAMHPLEAVRLSTLPHGAGGPVFPRLTATGGFICGLPVVVTPGAVVTGSPSERVFALIDGAQVILADDGEIAVTASSQVALQMDNAPTQDARDGTGSTIVSMFQTESTALKVVRTVNWQRCADAAVAWMTCTG